MVTIRKGYKETEIGVIPEEWKVESVESLSRRVCVGFVGTCNESYTSEENGIPMIRTTNLNTDGVNLGDLKYVTRKFHDKNKKSQLSSGDILVARHGSNGKACLFNHDFEANSLNVVIIRPNTQKIDSFYFKEFFNSRLVTTQVTKNIGGSVQSVINTKAIAAIKIAFPPLPEQQRIAEILSTSDEYIEKLDKTIEDYQLLKKGMMKKLLTEGIGHTEFKETEVGRIPKEWEVKGLGEFTSVTKLAGFEFTKYIEYNDDGEIIALRALNVKNGKLNLDNVKRISRESSDGLTRSKLYKGDLLFTYVGTIGEVALIEENDKYHLAPNVAKITVVKDVNTRYLTQYLMSNIAKQGIQKRLTTTSQSALSMGNLREVEVKLPPILEQQKIAEILSDLDNRIDLYQQEQLDFIQLKKALMEKLLTGKIRTI